MRSNLVVALIIASTLLSSSVAGNAGSVVAVAAPIPNDAPIGHLQPRGRQFAPDSSAEQDVQRRMSILDAEQQRLDQQLDERLNICREC